jgi:peptidoglycan/xylan/chitin deacetylase (PgdA/CDA1 family)
MRVSALLSLLFTAAAIAKPIDKASSVKVGNHTVTPEMALQILRKRATKTSTSLAAVGAPSGPNVDDGVYVSCNRPKIFSLTFDDGPSDYSWDLAKDLHAQGVRATYFINGKNWV